jgi:hypothetical protein
LHTVFTALRTNGEVFPFPSIKANRQRILDMTRRRLVQGARRDRRRNFLIIPIDSTCQEIGTNLLKIGVRSVFVLFGVRSFGVRYTGLYRNRLACLLMGGRLSEKKQAHDCRVSPRSVSRERLAQV